MNKKIKVSEPRLVEDSRIIYILKQIWWLYTWFCSVGVTAFIILTLVYYFGIGG